MISWLRRFRPKASPDPGLRFRQAYASFRRLLGRNNELLSLLADLDLDLKYEVKTAPRVRERIRRIINTSLELIQDLNELEGKNAADLFPAHQAIEKKILALLAASDAKEAQPLIVQLAEKDARKKELTGGKAAHLASLYSFCPEQVPEGFIITTAAYRLLVAASKVMEQMQSLVANAGGEHSVVLSHAEKLRSQLLACPVSEEISEALERAVTLFPAVTRWAVRSSCLGEDGALSFAGQFETLLGVTREKLLDAYRQVIASRFSERALSYRIAGGLAEIETPMAVLFLPMIDARAAGVLYTNDPTTDDKHMMWLSSTFGLGADLVGGKTSADFFIISRDPLGQVIETRIAEKQLRLSISSDRSGTQALDLLPNDRQKPSLETKAIEKLARLGVALEQHFGGPQDIEWAIDANEKIWLLQTRPLYRGESSAVQSEKIKAPIKVKGRPLAPGRAAGTVFITQSAEELNRVPEGAVLVTKQAIPEIALALPRIAAVVAETGSPLSHAASLCRQARIPAVSEIANIYSSFKNGEAVSVDGNRGEIYAGILWPELFGRKLSARSTNPAGALFETIFQLTLIDPRAKSFRAENCVSIHDIVRFVHENALAAMFRFGDRFISRSGKLGRRLKSTIPLYLEILDLGSGLSETAPRSKQLSPEYITSIPFQAFWKGVSDERVKWAGRQMVSAGGFMSVVQTSMAKEMGALRRLGERNYLVVAEDYMNLNARLAYHYTMLDCVVGEIADNNYVAFRFQGGAANQIRRDLRVKFLSEVLRALGFTTEKRGDLINAWLRAFPRSVCEEGLTHLGRLLACARQLDMLLDNEAAVKHYVKSFLDENYQPFA